MHNQIFAVVFSNNDGIICEGAYMRRNSGSLSNIINGSLSGEKVDECLAMLYDEQSALNVSTTMSLRGGLWVDVATEGNACGAISRYDVCSCSANR